MMMDTLGLLDRSLYALDGMDNMDNMDNMGGDDMSLLDVCWDSDLNSQCNDPMKSGCSGDSLWSGVLDNKLGNLIKNDRLLTDSAPIGQDGPSPAVKHEHSYSLGTASGMTSDGDSIPDSPLSLNDDMENECFPCIPMKNASGHQQPGYVNIKEEPMSPVNVVDDDDSVVYNNLNNCLGVKQEPGVMTNIKQEPGASLATKVIPTTSQQSLLKPPAIVLSTRQAINGRLLYPKVSVKLEPESSSSLLVNRARLVVSSVPTLNTPTTGPIMTTTNCHMPRQPINTPLISSQPKGASGVIFLTEEEKRTLITEGYPIPTKLPLSKTEERSLKKIRRKIKNKISAQESRRKKKEYMDALERKCDIINSEASGWRAKAEALEAQNAALLRQVAQLQSEIAAATNRGSHSQQNQQSPPAFGKIPPITISGRTENNTKGKKQTISLANDCLEIDVD